MLGDAWLVQQNWENLLDFGVGWVNYEAAKKSSDYAYMYTYM